MGRGGAVATNLPSSKEFCGFTDDALTAKFFGVVAVLIVMVCFGLMDMLSDAAVPSTDQCNANPQFMNFEGNDLIKGGIAIQNTAGQPGTVQCCDKCALVPGTVMWVYFSPLAISGTDLCFCKSKVGTGVPDTQYVAVKLPPGFPPAPAWGGAFLVALGGTGLAYLLCGVAINHQRGLRDMDMIPNSSFWATVPSLVIDGVMFASSGCSSGGSAGYSSISPAEAGADVESAPEDVPSMLPDVESLGAEIMQRDERERKARKKAAKKAKKKRGSVPSLSDETEREIERQKLREKDKRSRRKSDAVTKH